MRSYVTILAASLSLVSCFIALVWETELQETHILCHVSMAINFGWGAHTSWRVEMSVIC